MNTEELDKYLEDTTVWINEVSGFCKYNKDAGYTPEQIKVWGDKLIDFIENANKTLKEHNNGTRS